MATDQILFKAERRFIAEIDKAVKEGNYHSRTEFIREALRKNLDDARLKKAMAEIAHLRGAAKKRSQTTDEELEKIREQAFEDISKRFR
ncbi:MAG: ribbon-helix-helix protein, CopG family [Nanoarchaeota archaeon]|nr:ribbon-helix-helix protein, CopG family [Nanoarchaeota archaeon]